MYLSDRGGFVGSANASANGLGAKGPAVLLAVGMFLNPAEPAFQEASNWFQTVWNRSDKVDEKALRLARANQAPSVPAVQVAPKPGSLLDRVRTDPARFSDISFVLVQTKIFSEGAGEGSCLDAQS